MKANFNLDYRHKDLNFDLPRLKLAELPTPLKQYPLLSKKIRINNLLIKHEDKSGIALGGNKPRQIEAILADVINKNCDTIITTAGSQSNFCREISAATAKLGLECHLILRGKKPDKLEGNQILYQLFGAKIHWCNTHDPYSNIITKEVSLLFNKLKTKNKFPYVVRLPKQTAIIAAKSGLGLLHEIKKQFNSDIDYIVLAAGSGLTAAGLLAGICIYNYSTNILVFSVQQKHKFINKLILKRAQEVLNTFDTKNKINLNKLIVDDNFIGPGYGFASNESLKTTKLVAEYSGLLFDPIYTSKAFAGLIYYRKNNKIKKNSNIVFIHSGGLSNYNLFDNYHKIK